MIVSDKTWRRFWRKVIIHPSGCWLWVGAVSHGRRGRRVGHLQIGRCWPKAHRLSLTWAVGQPPADNMEAGHRCPSGPNSLCVNPGHLYWVTRVENEADKRRYA
jgi:hypothetical protein